MKAVISSLLLSAAAVASATNCDVSALTEIASTDDAATCKSASNFMVPVESTVNTILTDWGSFCASDECRRVLDGLRGIKECSIDGESLRQSVVNPIDDVCNATRALRAADGSHVHSSGMDMGSASAEAEDSHEATSSSTASLEAEDSHDSASSGAEDSHDTTSSASASAEAGDEGSHDHTSSTGSTATISASKSSGSSTGSKATSSNSTSSTQAPTASSTSSATSISIAAGSVFLAAVAAFG